MNTRSIKRPLLLLVVLVVSLVASAQSDTLRLSVQLTFRKAFISGICFMTTDSARNSVGSVMNEFGLKAFDFVYDSARNKLQLEDVMPALDKWYIRRVLRRDLLQIVPKLVEHGECHYTNSKRVIDYVFKPLEQHDNENGE